MESAAAALPLPLTGSGLNFGFTVEGRPAPAAGADLTANYTALTPDYFRVLRIPLMRGRLFTASDAASAPKVCVISEALARRHFPGEDPIGRRIAFGFTESVPRTIVGVVGDVKRDGVAAASKPEMYVPFEQEPWWASYLAIRTKSPGDSGALAAAIRREVAALDPSLPGRRHPADDGDRPGFRLAASLPHDAALPFRRHGPAAGCHRSLWPHRLRRRPPRHERSPSVLPSARAGATSSVSCSARASL